MVKRVAIDPATAAGPAPAADAVAGAASGEGISDAPADVSSGVAADVPGYIPRDPRLTTILLVARMSTRGWDDLCCVRNISAGGMRIDTLVPLVVGQDIDIEFKNGITVQTQVAWVGRGEAGLRCYTPITIERVLAQPTLGPVTALRAPRAPRLSTLCPVALRCNGHLLRGNLENISQGGAQVRLSAPTPVDGAIVLIAPGLGSIHATMRWQTRDVVGMAFLDTLGFADLSRWLASSQRFSADDPAASSPSCQSS